MYEQLALDSGFIGIAFLLIVTPLLASATAVGALASSTSTNSAADIQNYWTPERMQSAQPMGLGVVLCPRLYRNLSFGSRGQDVVELQNFLIAQGDLMAENNTGFDRRDSCVIG